MADPTTRSWSGYWRADYSASPWVGVATAGASSGRDLTEATNPPTTGTAVNGYVPANFDGTNDLLTADLTADDYVGASAMSVHAVVYIDTAAAPGTYAFDDACIVVAQYSGIFGLGVSSSGVRFGVYTTSGYYETAAVALSTGAWHRVQARYDGTNVSVRIDGGSWTNTAATDPFAAGGSPMLVGVDIVGTTTFLDGKALEVCVSTTAFSDAVMDDIDAYAVARYFTTTASVVMGATAVTPTWPSPTVVSRQAVVMGALAPTPSWPSPVVLGRQVISFDALTATPSWPSPTLTANASVVMGALAPTPSWPSPTVVSRQAVVFDALTATPAWPSPTVLGRQVIAMGAMAATPSWPSPTLTSRQAVVMGALTATPAWPSPAVVVAGYVDMAGLTATPSWPAATFTAQAAITFAALSATPSWPLAVFSVPVLPVVLLTTRSAGEVTTSATSAGETRSATRSAGETSTAGTSAGETRSTFRSSGETR